MRLLLLDEDHTRRNLPSNTRKRAANTKRSGPMRKRNTTNPGGYPPQNGEDPGRPLRREDIPDKMGKTSGGHSGGRVEESNCFRPEGIPRNFDPPALGRKIRNEKNEDRSRDLGQPPGVYFCPLVSFSNKVTKPPTNHDPSPPDDFPAYLRALFSPSGVLRGLNIHCVIQATRLLYSLPGRLLLLPV